MDLQAHLTTEFERRRGRNPRYSLRAFARDLGVHHTVLGRLLGGGRLTANRLLSLGSRLGLSASEVREVVAREGIARVLAVATRANFRHDSRWIAARTGLRLDEVNVALQRLLCERRLTMRSTTAWTLENT